MLARRFPEVSVVRLEENVGATGGFDEGMPPHWTLGRGLVLAAR